MSTSKKRKLSGQSGSKLDLVLAELQELRASVITEGVLESDSPPANTFADKLDSIIAKLESLTNKPVSLSFSAADEGALEKFNIHRKGFLDLRPEAELREAIIASRAVSSTKLWSNDNMCKHLSSLVNSFTNQDETSSQVIIDTFFFRSTAMVLPPQKAVVMLENPVPATHPRLLQMDTVSGVIDYTAIVAELSIAEGYLNIPPKINNKCGDGMTAFLVTEAKATVNVPSLEQHLPQVLLQLVASAKQLGRSHIRGALTTGFKWRFVAMDLDTDGDGAKYWVSQLIEWRWKIKHGFTPRECFIENTSDDSDPALIAGILSSWISESCVEFTGDQWFGQQHEGAASC